MALVRMHNVIERVLEEVRHVLELNRNLISLGTLDKEGCRYKCDHGSLEIYKGKNLIIRGVRYNGLYSLVGQTIVFYSANVVTDDNTKLWHYRLTHISQNGWMS